MPPIYCFMEQYRVRGCPEVVLMDATSLLIMGLGLPREVSLLVAQRVFKGSTPHKHRGSSPSNPTQEGSSWWFSGSLGLGPTSLF